MNLKQVALCFGYFLLAAISGELVVERDPCPGITALYRCTVNGGDLDWRWTARGKQPVDYTVISLLPTARVRTLLIGDTDVIFNTTEFNPSTISSLAIVSNPEILNGTVMTCGGQTHTISIPGTSIVPTALRVMRLFDNGSQVYIQLVTVEDASTISYQLSSSDIVMPWINPIILTVPEHITFFYCQYNETFMIDSCILDDDYKSRNYTIYPNGTWLISQLCGPPEVLVTCDDRSWSEDISCLESTNDLCTGQECEEMKTTKDTELATNLSPQKCPASCSAMANSLEIIMGSVIGTFVLTLIVGIVLGLLCGVKLARVKTSKQLVGNYEDSNHNTNLSKGPLYEEVAVDKNVKLSENVSYNIVKNL